MSRKNITITSDLRENISPYPSGAELSDKLSKLVQQSSKFLIPRYTYTGHHSLGDSEQIQIEHQQIGKNN